MPPHVTQPSWFDGLSLPFTVLALGLGFLLWRIGKYALWLATTGRLVGVLTGVLNSVTRVAVEGRMFRRLADSSRLWQLQAPRTWKAYLDFGTDLRQRLETFQRVFEETKVPFHGAYAVSMRIAREMRPAFEVHLHDVKLGYARFTQLADDYFTLWTRIQREVEEAAGVLREHANTLDRRAALLLIERRRLRVDGFWSSQGWSLERQKKWWRCGFQVRQIRRELKKAESRRRRLAEEVFAAHELELGGIVHRLVQLDEQVLRHRIHGLAADAGVLESLVMSGEVFNMLVADETDAARHVRAMLKLPADFPNDLEAARDWMVAWLRHDGRGARAVALSNKPAREDVLEWFLRYWLWEHDDVSFLDNLYLSTLPAAGSAGLAQGTYAHPVALWPPRDPPGRS